MGNGKWEMLNVKREMGNWEMENKKWEMGNWEMGNWEMGNGKFCRRHKNKNITPP